VGGFIENIVHTVSYRKVPTSAFQVKSGSEGKVFLVRCENEVISNEAARKRQ
jgi:hypothetical protein